MRIGWFALLALARRRRFADVEADSMAALTIRRPGLVHLSRNERWSRYIQRHNACKFVERTAFQRRSR